MDEKNKQLLDQILKYAAERKIQIPADIVLKLSTIYAEDLYSELKQGQAPSEMEGKILMGTLRKLVEQIVLEEIPEFGLMNPGFVPAPGRAGLMLMSTGWKPYLMPSAPGGGGGGGTGISDAPGDSQSYVRYNRTWIVMPPGVTQHSLLTGLDYASAGHTGFQPTLTFPLSPTLGGTGIANLAASTLTLGAATSITGGGTLDLGGFTGTVPATATFAMGAGTLTSSTTNDVTGATHTHAITKAPALVGNSGPGPLILTSSPLGVPAWSGYYLSGTTGGITTLAITADKTLTLTATDDRNITFPITGTAAIGAGTLTAATTNDVTVNAHTHAITASTALVAAGTAQYQVLTTGANPYPAGWSDFYLRGTTGGTTNFAVTNTKTLTLTATDSYNLTVPATGTAALLATANIFTAAQTITPTADGLSQFQVNDKDSNVILSVDTTNNRVGLGIASPAALLDLYMNIAGGTANTIKLKNESTTGKTIITCFNNSDKTAYFGTFGSAYAATHLRNAGVIGGDAAIIVMSDGKNAANGTDPIYFYAGGYDTTQETLRITPSGGIGSGSISIGGLAPSAKLHVNKDTTTTNAVIEVFRIESRVSTASTGSSAGFGPGQTFYGESATDATYRQLGQIDYTWATATDATRAARGCFHVYDTAQREAIRIEASGTAAMLAFYGGAAVARGAALTAQLTTLTYTAPGTPDYAIQDFIDVQGDGSKGFSFANKDEANSVLKVIANLQTRVAELEARLGSATGVNLFA